MALGIFIPPPGIEPMPSEVEVRDLRTTRKVPVRVFLCHQGIQFSSVARLCPTLGDPMNHSTPGLPVHRQLLEFTQTHVH